MFRQRFRREAREGTYVMHFAASGEEALELLGGGIEPGVIVILSDINMPGMDGLQLLGKIKQRRPDLPVIRSYETYPPLRSERLVVYPSPIPSRRFQALFVGMLLLVHASRATAETFVTDLPLD